MLRRKPTRIVLKTDDLCELDDAIQVRKLLATSTMKSVPIVADNVPDFVRERRTEVTNILKARK